MANAKTPKKSPKKGSKKVTKTVKNSTKTKKIETPKRVDKIDVEIKEENITKKPIENVKNDEKKTSKKKIITIGSIVLGIIIIIVLIILCITVFFNKEKVITRKIKAMGKDYYNNYYYDALSKNRKKEELDTILSKYVETGIKIDLKSLEKYSSGKYKEEIKKLKSDKKECDKSNTAVIIYPQEPYGKNNYKIKVELDCGF